MPKPKKKIPVTEPLKAGPTTPIVKKKRKKKRDSAFNKATYQKKKKAKSSDSAPVNYVRMRSFSNDTFEDDHGNKIAVKHATLIDEGLATVNKLDKKEMEKQLEQRFRKIKGSISVTRVEYEKRLSTPGKPNAPLEEKDTPVKVFSPGGTEYQKAKRFGHVRFFTNVPKKKLFGSTRKVKPAVSTTKTKANTTTSSQLTLPPKSPFYKSAIYKAVEKINTDYKIMKLTVDEALFLATDAEKRKNNNIRSISQTAVAKGSATEYTKATQLFPEIAGTGFIPREWLHLVAYQVLGSKSQFMGNYVAGTEHANSDMLVTIESLLRKLAKMYKGGFELEVIANLIPGTHVGTKISYNIKTPDFTLPLTFDAQEETKPLAVLKDYISDIIEVLEILSNKKQAKPTPTTATTSIKNTSPTSATTTSSSKSPSITLYNPNKRPASSISNKSASTTINPPSTKKQKGSH